MKKELKQVLLSGSWYVMGNFLIKAITFLSVSVFTRIMTVEDYGLYYSYLVYESTITAIMNLGFSRTIRVAKYNYKEQFGDYVASLAGYTTVSAVILSVLTLALSCFMPLNPLMLAAALLASFCNCIYQLVEQRCVIENQYKQYIGLSFLYNVPQIFLSIGLILLCRNQSTYVERLAGHVIPLILLFLLCFFSLIKKGRVRKDYIRYSLKLGIPVIFVSLSSTILTQSDRIVIGYFAGDEKVGIYSGVGYIGSILYIVMLSMQNVWTRIFMEHFTEKKNQEIRRKIVPYVLIYMIPVFGLMALGKELSVLFLAKEYQVGTALIVPLCLGWFYNFLSCILSEIEYASGKGSYLAVGIGMGAVVNLITNLLFIPRYGYEAAAVTTAFAYFCVFLFHLAIEHKVCRTKTYSSLFLCSMAGIVFLYACLIQNTLYQCGLRYLIGIIFIIGDIIFFLLTQVYNKNKGEKS